MFTFKSFYGEYKKCKVKKSGSGKYTRYDIWNNEGPVLSINLPGYGESETKIALDHNFKDEVMKFLEDHKIILQHHGDIPSGYVRLPIITIDAEKLMSL